MMCCERPRPLHQLETELRELGRAIRAFAAARRGIEEYQARVDYCGLLVEICQRKHLNPLSVFHPLLGAPEGAPFGVPVLC